MDRRRTEKAGRRVSANGTVTSDVLAGGSATVAALGSVTGAAINADGNATVTTFASLASTVTAGRDANATAFAVLSGSIRGQLLKKPGEMQIAAREREAVTELERPRDGVLRPSVGNAESDLVVRGVVRTGSPPSAIVVPSH